MSLIIYVKLLIKLNTKLEVKNRTHYYVSTNQAH